MKKIEYLLSTLICIIMAFHTSSVLGFYFDTLYYKIIFLLLEGIFILLLGFIYTRNKANHLKKRTVINIHYFICILYLISLFDVLFLSGDLQRGSTYVADYSHMNVVPFETIKLYFNGYVQHSVSLESLIFNIFGNMILFMPLAYFLPFFFRTQRKWYTFLPTILSIALVVEVLQINLMVGSADIDDIILNVVGAMIFYMITQLSFSKVVYRVLGRE